MKMYAKSFASSWPLSMQGGSWVDAFPMETAPHRPRSLRPYSDRAATFILRSSHRKALRLVPPTSKRLERTHHNKHVLCRTTSVARSGPPSGQCPTHFRGLSHRYLHPQRAQTATSDPSRWPCNRYSRSRMDPSSAPPTRIKSDHREKINVEVCKMLMLVVCPSSIDLFDWSAGNPGSFHRAPRRPRAFCHRPPDLPNNEEATDRPTEAISLCKCSEKNHILRSSNSKAR